ncbi:Phosphoprotein phosphatase [Mycena venus]|uniref:Mitochondrial import inner membrane translocase subunit TIM50 n=1 Tax=Mycena venus TaxID=2733690 RepID=A0A8H6YZ56_9AGAR|nr:Phosphoprotein phosphatase [Mycena venus]
MSQAPKKLLILDLNGTLLLRSKRTRSGPSVPNLGTRSRLVHPRPYLNTFKEYIFHPATMQWLDTMVWSSAQPPSVADMVNHCFGLQQRKFLAIWARDTMGLPPALYQTQTSPNPGPPSPEHSRHTTLLLDDSARKAHLHPHNHVCVREYLQETRRHDLEVLGRSNSKPPPADSKPKKRGKSKSKTEKAPEPELAVSELPVDVDVSPAWLLESPKYDETLLAVVGILETVKTLPNVAEWIGGGGLLAKEVKEAVVVDSERISKEEESDSPDSLAPQLAALKLAQAQELWFNSEATVTHWVDRGVHALEALQIPVVAGIRGGDLVPPSRT